MSDSDYELPPRPFARRDRYTIAYTDRRNGKVLTATNLGPNVAIRVEDRDIHVPFWGLIESLRTIAAPGTFDAPAPKVQTVADLTLGHAEGTRIRVTTERGIHEGHLSGVRLRHGTDSSGVRIRLFTDEYVLTIGGADIRVDGTDKAEVIA